MTNSEIIETLHRFQMDNGQRYPIVRYRNTMNQELKRRIDTEAVYV